MSAPNAPKTPVRTPLPTPQWMLTARPVVAAIILVALAAAALLPGDDVAFLVVAAALAACSLFALHLGNLQRPDYTKRNAIVMLGLLGVFALVGAGRFAWTVLGA